MSNIGHDRNLASFRSFNVTAVNEIQKSFNSTV